MFDGGGERLIYHVMRDARLRVWIWVWSALMAWHLIYMALIPSTASERLLACLYHIDFGPCVL